MSHLSSTSTARTITAFLALAAGLSGQTGWFAGGVGGISTLSGDAKSNVTSTAVATSLYKPENGPTLQLFAGRHLSDWWSLQLNYRWNRNTQTLSLQQSSPNTFEVYEQNRNSQQHSVLGEVLFFFRKRSSVARPYLSAGAGWDRFSSTTKAVTARTGALPLPPDHYTSTAAAFRVAVGIDVRIARGWRFRYSFAETIRANPISSQITPAEDRNLANFQNLWGFLKEF